LTLASMNKKNMNFFYIHNFYYIFFYYISCFWRQASNPAGKNTKGMHVLFTRAQDTRARTLVKVIKLPSHSVLVTLNYFLKWRCKGDEVIPASGDGRCCFWRPKMLAALMMILAYCFLWSSFYDHLSVLSFLISQ